MEIVGFKIIRFYSSVGDHRGIVFDVSSRSLLRKYESRLVKAGCRRLSSKNTRSVSKYNKLFEEQVKQRKLNEKLDKLDLELGDNDTLTKE